MNGLKAVLVLLAMVMIVDGINREGRAEQAQQEKAECNDYSERMLERYVKRGYVEIKVDCSTLIVVEKLTAQDVINKTR